MKLQKFFLKGYDTMNFAEKVKILRKRYELTQEELAKQVGTSQRTIFTYENGTIPRKAMLKKLADCLYTTPEFLIDDEQDMPEDDLSESYVEEMREKHGEKAAANLQNLYKQTAIFFAGGAIPQEDKDRFFEAISSAYEKTRETSLKKHGKVLDVGNDNNNE